jgi:hypothetical protein
MAMSTYKIIFQDNKAEDIQYARQDVHGDWMSFSDGEGLILQVRAADVKRIERKRPS